MFDYLQKFNNLPKDLRDQVSSSVVMTALSELEKKYKVDLAMTVMKVMIKELALDNLPIYFVSQLALSSVQAETLAKEMKEKVFTKTLNYLASSSASTPISTPTSAPAPKPLDLKDDVSLLIKEIGLMLPSEVLINRFKNILTTYTKGVRNKIDTRATLTKSVDQGGLNLSAEQADKVFKVCDQKTFKNLEPTFKKAPPASRLDKIISQAEKGRPAVEEYSLKKALAEDKTKKPILDTSHELPLPKEAKEKKLPLPKKKKALPKPIETTPVSVPPKSTPIPKEPLPAKSESKEAPKSVHKIEQPKKKSIKLGKLFKSEKKVVPTPEPIKKPITPIKTPAPIKPKEVKKEIKTSPSSRSAPAPSVAKPKVHDIKPVPKVMSPIEELQYLDLVNFRRLGKTPTEMIGKVFSKIKLLEGEGYDKMITGVKAWRKSPVNRLYLKIGQEAINKGISMQKAAEARQDNKEDYLNIEEIEAIVSLNSKLAF